MSTLNESRLHRRNFDISFNELYDMYKEGELIIQPEFQRLFRWSLKQQSLFIESLLLDMPIPPIYVDEQQDGSYVLVDGLQRISSYLNFRGVQLNANDKMDTIKTKIENENIIAEEVDDYYELHPSESTNPGFELKGCEILDSLNGKTYNSLSIIERRSLKRVFIRVEVLTKDNDKSTKYHMFKRLNSGGSLLSEQELRNSNIRMIDGTFINFINDLAENEHFKQLTMHMNIKDQQQMKRSENVLRYFMYKNKFLTGNGHKDSFRLDEELTMYLEEVTEGKVSFDFEVEKRTFERLVKYLNEKFGPDIFGGVTKSSEKITKSLILYNYDGFMLFFANPENQKESITLEQITEIKRSPGYLGVKTGGIENVKSRIRFIKDVLGEME